MLNKPEELNLANKENAKDQKYSENDEYVLSEWQAPKNKTGFFIFLFSSKHKKQKNPRIHNKN